MLSNNVSHLTISLSLVDHCNELSDNVPASLVCPDAVPGLHRDTDVPVSHLIMPVSYLTVPLLLSSNHIPVSPLAFFLCVLLSFVSCVTTFTSLTLDVSAVHLTISLCLMSIPVSM